MFNKFNNKWARLQNEENESETAVVSLKPLSQLRGKKKCNDQELIQSDPTSCPQNQKGNN